MLQGTPAAGPSDAIKIALVLALAFFIGLEREEHKQLEPRFAFGGVRTFPLIGLVSYTLALMSGPPLIPWVIGLIIVGSFTLLSYYHKLANDPPAGFTTELSALATYIVGGLVQHDYYWIATTIGVLSVLLLQLKKALENLTSYVASNEIVTAAKFLLLAAVILPVVPNEDLTRFHINPLKTWLVVVAVSGVSFVSYALQRWLKARGGVLLSAILGGAYSSTVTTLVLARQARREGRPNLFAGGIVTASGVMYARLVILIACFNLPLALRLAPTFLTLGITGVLAGWLVARRGDRPAVNLAHRDGSKNPLELSAAFLFAAAFIVILVLTSLVRAHMGRTGLYSLAAIMGVTDVDPFILGLAQGGVSATPLSLAAEAIVIAAASNNAIKGVYAYSVADRRTGRVSVALLLALALLGLAPLAWM